MNLHSSKIFIEQKGACGEKLKVSTNVKKKVFELVGFRNFQSYYENERKEEKRIKWKKDCENPIDYPPIVKIDA